MSDSPNIPLDSGASPARPVTLHDLAQVLGISYVTVSLALRDRGRISEGLRARIKQTAKEMNYRADPMALALVQYRSRKPSSSIHSALAWINLWKDPKKLRSYREFDLYWQGAYATADAAGYRLEEFSIDEKLSLARLKTILHTRRIGGIILPPQEQPVDWNGFDWKEFSVVRIGHSLPTPEAHVVAPDQVGNAILAYSRIRELGYKRVGFICNRGRVPEPRTWFSGGILMMQLNDARGEMVPPLVREPGQSDAQKSRQLRDWLKRHRPDAVLTESAEIQAMLEAVDYPVPDRIGVAALSVLDGKADAGIYQNAEEIGKVAAETVIAQINRNERGCPRDFRMTMIRGRWVDGKTLPARE